MLKITRKLFFVISFLYVGLAFNGCKVLNPSEMLSTPGDYAYKSFEEEEKEYIIRPYDKLQVRVFTNDGLKLIDTQSGGAGAQSSNQFSYLVDFEGMVKLPSLGLTKLAGMTLKESEAYLEEAYEEYYQKPFVMLEVTNRRVVIFTAGSSSGSVLTIDNERFTLLEALAQAGGIDNFSKAYRIKLLRGDLNDPQVYLFDISSVEEMSKANLVLQANDIIYVEQRPRYAARTLSEIMPYITLFNTFLLLYVGITSF